MASAPHLRPNLQSGSDAGVATPPWGKLEVVSLTVQPKDDYLKDYGQRDSLESLIRSSERWIFKKATFPELQRMFSGAGLSAAVCDQLMQATKPLPEGDGFVTTPPDRMLWNFSPAIRSRLYPLIGRYQENWTYRPCFYFNSPCAQDWTRNSALRPELVEKLSRLIYRLDYKLKESSRISDPYSMPPASKVPECLCLISDLHLIVPYLKTNQDWIDLVKTMYRTPAVKVYLRIEEGEDISRLVDYYGPFDRAKIIRPLLEQLRDRPGGGRIDIVKLLPPIPQEHLNRFVPLKESQNRDIDCHWAMLNFFDAQPDERIAQPQEIRFTILNKVSQRLPVEGQPKFGDIILIKDASSELLHSCVYIAKDIVFTKNGVTTRTANPPFILSTLDKVLSIYSPYQGEVHVEIYARTVADTHRVRAALGGREFTPSENGLVRLSSF